VLIRRDPVTGKVSPAPKNQALVDWLALRDQVLTQIPGGELDAVLDRLRDTGAAGERDWL
jgi:muramidase (phage lysozyme)